MGENAEEMKYKINEQSNIIRIMKKEKDSTKSYQYYLNKIVDFNSDKNLLAIHEQYNEPSFFEIISKTRSETTYSSFLKWLFQIKSPHNEIISPVMMLLDILVKRSFQQDPRLFDSEIRRSVLSRKIGISNVQVETEKQVSILAQEAINHSNISGEILKGINTYCQDRIDIFIECNIELDGVSKKLQIIIENKIDSTEGGANIGKKSIPENLKKEYFDKPQTTRYYIGSHRIDSEKICQIYTYLTPLASHRLSEFNKLKEEQDQYNKEKKGKNKIRVLREDDHYIQINYQDILDGIIIPLLSSPSLPTRNRFFLEEFKNELMFPNIENFNEHSCIAISQETSDAITTLWMKYKDLIIDSIMASTLTDNNTTTNFWIINGTYYDHQPRLELLKMLYAKNPRSIMSDDKDGSWLIDKHANYDKKVYGELDDNLLFRKGIRYSNIVSLAKENGIIKESVEKEIDLGFNCVSEECNLLKSFYDENSNFIFAFMNAIKEGERKKVECFFNYLNKKDRTKYTLFYDNKCIGTNMGYTATAFAIVKLWAKENKSQLTGNSEEVLKKMNKGFPREINSYYERGKWFKYLIYEYKPDGKYQYDDLLDGEVQANWDFYKPDSRIEHYFDVNGTKVTMLKMWHEVEVESLINHICKNFKDFGKKLLIIRS